MLIVIDTHFTWHAFITTTLSCAAGVFMVATSLDGYFLTTIPGPVRLVMALAVVLLVAPGMKSDLYAAVLLVPVMAHQFIYWRRGRENATEETFAG